MTTIITKNSSTASSVPVAGDLTKGELAVNVTDKKLYTKDNGGSVVKLVGSLGNQEASAVAITGGAIDGTPIGGTTASTASFTTVSASGNVTLSGGTANGVLYLNGSKVATSGSALTFDGTSLAVGGVATVQGELNVFKTGSAPTLYVQSDASNSTTQGIIRIGGSSGRSASIQGYRESGGSNYHALRFYSYNAADQLNYEITSGGTSIWSVGGSEAMRLTSTGLGIGTSSPNNYGSNYKVVQASAYNSGIFQATSTNYGITAEIGTNSTSGVIGTRTNHPLQLKTNDTAQATLDSSGNLGLGVTPSAWNSAVKAMQISTAATFWGLSNNQAYVGSNSFYDAAGNFKYIVTDNATQYRQWQGAHAWFTAPSGTAGDAITFTQAMTLDASGNLGVGTTSPATYGKLAVESGANAIVARSGSSSFCEINVQSGSADAVKGQFQAIEGSTNKVIIGARTNHPLAFNTNDTERARIDSSGNLLVGTTSNKGLGITAESTSNTIWATCTVSGQSALVVQNTNGGAVNLVAFQTGSGLGTGVGSIYYSAGLTVYATTSDYRLKNVIGEVTGSGARIDALEPVEYEWKSSGERTRGFLAHKFQEVYPQSVSGEKDAVDENGNPKYQHMQASTSEVIADLVAEIKSLRARVAQLESN